MASSRGRRTIIWLAIADLLASSGNTDFLFYILSYYLKLSNWHIAMVYHTYANDSTLNLPFVISNTK